MKRTLRTIAALALSILLMAHFSCGAPPRTPVTVFVVDEFAGARSHGRQVLSAIDENSDGCCEIREMSAGEDRIDVRLYLKALSEILDYSEKNPDVGIVVNLSFGSYSSNPQEQKLIESLAAKGAVLIAAAGNEGDPEPQYPAAYEAVAAVAAVDSAGRRESYSNYGPHIDVAARGFLNREVVSSRLQPEGARLMRKTVFLIRGGTSFAAARVTGLVANVWSRRPDLSGRQALDLIKSTATPAAEGLGAGLIDRHRVLMTADPAYREFYELKWKSIRIAMFLFFAAAGALFVYYMANFFRVRREEARYTDELTRSTASANLPSRGAGQAPVQALDELEGATSASEVEVSLRCTLCGILFTTPYASLNHRIGICPSCRDRIIDA